MKVLTMTGYSPASSLGDGNLTETYPRYVLNKIIRKLKTNLQCCMVGKGLKALFPPCTTSGIHRWTQKAFKDFKALTITPAWPIQASYHCELRYQTENFLRPSSASTSNEDKDCKL